MFYFGTIVRTFILNIPSHKYPSPTYNSFLVSRNLSDTNTNLKSFLQSRYPKTKFLRMSGACRTLLRMSSLSKVVFNVTFSCPFGTYRIFMNNYSPIYSLQFENIVLSAQMQRVDQYQPTILLDFQRHVQNKLLTSSFLTFRQLMCLLQSQSFVHFSQACDIHLNDALFSHNCSNCL